MAVITIKKVCAEFPTTRYFADKEGHILFGLPIPDHPEMHCQYDTETDTVIFDFDIDEYIKVWEQCLTEMEKESEESEQVTDVTQEQTAAETVKEDVPDTTPEQTETNIIEVQGSKLRTRKQANADIIPGEIATPSTHTFQTALTVIDGKNAHMVPIDQTIKLTIENGRWYFNVIDESEINLAKIKDTELAKIDLWTLRVLYSVIGKKLIQEFNDQSINLEQLEKFPVKIYIPDLLRAMGVTGNPNKKNINSLIDTIRTGYANVIGVIPVKQNGKIYHNKYAVIAWHSYNEVENTVTFASPYMNYLLYNIIKSSIRRDKAGKIKTNKKGYPLLTANHSYLVKSTIASERNKRAAENVRYICVLIEQAGNHTPRATASTIIKNNPELEQALNEIADAANKNRLLKRTFLKTWELLRTQTRLLEFYPDIKIPDTFPTMSTLDMVFEFPHSGKKKA